MDSAAGHARTLDVSGVVGPSRWWTVVDALDDVPPGWNDGRWEMVIAATSDDFEKATATHVEAVQRSVASWDGELETLSVARGPAEGVPGGYRVKSTFRRGVGPRVEVSGPDAAAVDAFAAVMEARLSQLVTELAAEDARAVPLGDAAKAWRRTDRLSVGIAVGISVIVVLAVAGAVWAIWKAS